MPTNYTGTPLESDWEKIQRRREINNAIVRQSMAPYRGTESAVGGRAVDNRWGSGISKLGQALVGAWGNKKLNEQSKALGEKYDVGRKADVEGIINALSGQDNVVGPQGPRQPKPDPAKAGLLYATSPYLQGGDSSVARALINSKTYGSRKGRGGYSRIIYGEDGQAYAVNTRDQSVTPLNAPGGGQIKDPRYTPESQFNLKNAQQLGTGTAEAVTDPVTASGVRQAEKDVDLAMNPEIKEATDLAERDAEKTINKPKIEGTLSAAETKIGMLDGLIDKAKDQGGIWTTGFLGAATGWIPGTPAHDLGNTLSTIKANIGFDKLQEMRNNSPTGGALGQVSEFENRLLQAVWGALEQSQSPSQFNENLVLVNKQVKESWKRIKEAYKKDYGTEYQEGGSKGNYENADKERRYQEWKAKQ